MDLRTAVILSILPGVSPYKLAAAVRDAARSGEAAVLDDILLRLDRRDDTYELGVRAAEALSRASRLRVTPIAWSDPRYPASLAAIPDPPMVLWVRGDPGVLAAPSVAIVGSRAATAYALEVASYLAEGLAARGVVVVSGLARGVDSAAHRGCLNGGGRTVGVLGSGVDVIYPAENAGLARDVIGCGALVSELLPGTPARPFHFPARNRMISGFSLAVVVVEASERSGSLSTARAALEQGREVMVVPGNILSGRNRGSHRLIKDGAKIVEAADDILAEIPCGLASSGDETVGKRHGRNGLVGKTDRLLNGMAVGEPYELDALIELSGLDAPKLLPRLLQLELDGLVARVGGGRFVRPGGKVVT